MVGEEIWVLLCSVRRSGDGPLLRQNPGKESFPQHLSSGRLVGSVFLAKNEGLPPLAYVTPRALVKRRVEERETMVFAGEFVTVMHSLITGGAEGGLIRIAKHQCICFVADVALYLHVLPFLLVKETVTEDNISGSGNTDVSRAEK
ncbi:hypothetical protein AMTRI_Chr12g268750 [Amborella trichopoda]